MSRSARLLLGLFFLLAMTPPRPAKSADTPSTDETEPTQVEKKTEEQLKARSSPPDQMLEGPVDPALYHLGPGDLLDVRIGSTPPIDRVLRVAPQGTLIFPEGALVRVAGLSVAKAESVLTQDLSRYYRKPEVRLNLLELRTFGVFVIGEVVRPGMARGSAVDRASALIERVGGLKPTASNRAIMLTRSTGEVLPVDLLRFEANGALQNDPIVEAGDRIYVPPAGAMAVVSGAVRKPGTREVIAGDSVATMVGLAHGLRDDALLDSAYVESFEGTPARSTRRNLDLRDPASWRVQIHPRDLVFVRPRPNWTETRAVILTGEVQYPGTHALPADSLPLTQVIGLAGGFTRFASLGEAYISRPVEKIPPDPEFERLSKLSATDMTTDEYDYYVMKLRGRNPIVSTDFVQLFQKGDLSFDVNIHPGDQITVPREEPYVRVVGEVARPGNVPYVSNLSVDDYIAKAGGYTFRSAKARVTVIRAVTGEWERKGKADRLGPGDTIWIPQKRHNFWKDALAGIGVVSQLATIYLVIQNATK